ncbi:MAG: helix-turn-helix domain-containing protein [Promethearchaeota archaeon]
MIEARIEIVAEGYYSCDITRRIPVRVNLISINGPLGFGIIQSLTYEESPLIEYVNALSKSASIVDVSVTHKTPEQYWTKVVHKLSTKSIHETILDCGCMSRFPIVIQGGKQVHHLLAPTQSAFSLAFDTLKSNFKKVSIRSVHHTPIGISGPGLTGKQLEAVKEAITHGYYEIPRKCDVEFLARRLNVKRVATQERLRRAERKIMNQFAADHL